MNDANVSKKPLIFYCQYCDFNTCNKKDYNRHLSTKKHTTAVKILTNVYTQGDLTSVICKKYTCVCGKYYTHRQSLFNHKKKCVSILTTIEEKSNIIEENPNIIEEKHIEHETTSSLENTQITDIDTMLNDKELIITLLKKTVQLQNQLIEMCKDKTVTNNNITNNNMNSHNKTFNLQFFLNETCKDAMNIMDFVDSIKLQLSDLESVGRLGYVEGISNIITKHLNALDVTQRPIHCTDKKREIMYVKDEDKWEKENEERKKLRKVIRRVADKNARLLPEFKRVHPDCSKSSSQYSDQYNKLIVESMGGSGDNDAEKEDKIIHKIARNVVIDKSGEI